MVCRVAILIRSGKVCQFSVRSGAFKLLNGSAGKTPATDCRSIGHCFPIPALIGSFSGISPPSCDLTRPRQIFVTSRLVDSSLHRHLDFHLRLDITAPSLSPFSSVPITACRIAPTSLDFRTIFDLFSRPRFLLECPPRLIPLAGSYSPTCISRARHGARGTLQRTHLLAAQYPTTVTICGEVLFLGSKSGLGYINLLLPDSYKLICMSRKQNPEIGLMFSVLIGHVADDIADGI